MDVYSVAQVRAAEAALQETVPAGALMQRAAFGLATNCAQLLRSVRGKLYGSRVVLLVGGGNNGGDALFAGALLCRQGVKVTAVVAPKALASQETLPLTSHQVAPTAHEEGVAALKAAGGRIESALSREEIPDMVVDGLTGIGARGPLRAEYAELVEYALWADQAGALIVAVDIPSGVNPDTGQVYDRAVRADVTVTFGAHKISNVVTPGAWQAGVVRLVDIGLEPHLPELPVARLVTEPNSWPVPTPGDTKYTRGVLGVVAGSQRYPGAAQLVVGGALAMDTAGMVRYVGPVGASVVERYPNVIPSWTLAETGRVQAWVVGPGLGTDDAGASSLYELLSSDQPVVVDADALTMLAAHPARFELVRQRRAPTILTPHEGEFVRLFGPINGRRLDAARHAALFADAIVVLKGDRTIVAAPGEPPLVGPTGAAALATAGTGDVLAGAIGALLAAGFDPVLAAADAVYLHAQAGMRAAQRGPVTAPDVVDALGPPH
ncbi:MAG: NAD(P)H-hydrate dehydratase [Corynebacteriales bacterium]|nr:NAD(P)H-hydrate dehydratase [Mycobacteriales bacterium]